MDFSNKKQLNNLYKEVDKWHKMTWDNQHVKVVMAINNFFGYQDLNTTLKDFADRANTSKGLTWQEYHEVDEIRNETFQRIKTSYGNNILEIVHMGLQ